MDISQLSPKYKIRKLTEADIDSIYALSISNPLFYQHCPPYVTRERILKEMYALPPRTTYGDKYYIGFWNDEELIAVMDLILNYPNIETAFIGLFMMIASKQGVGIGSNIITDLCEYLKSLGYRYVRLGYTKGNPQSQAFWTKNLFISIGIEYETDGYIVVVLQRSLW